MLKSFLPLLFMCFNLLIVNAQQDEHLKGECFTDQLLKSLMDKNPEIRKEYQEYKKQYQVKPENYSSFRRDVITIPVVVHVIHSGEAVGSGSNISMTKVLEQIEILNDDFGFRNTDRQHIPDHFINDAGPTNIQFCLITKMPNGDPHNGVNRIKYNNIPDVSYIEDVIKPATIWNPIKFLNIWVVQIPTPGILGYSYLPIPSILNSSKDGVVIDTDKFGNNGSYIKGRTATHEVGHYLGLQHPWGEIESCSSDDGIADTPNCAGPYFGCPNGPQYSCGTIDMSMNFMDYVDDPCMYMFSKGQGIKMNQILADERFPLSSGAGYICDLNLTSNQNIGLEAVPEIYPNPTTGQINIKNSEVFENQVVVFELHDLSGKKVFEIKQLIKDDEEDININLSSFNSGTYIMRMTSEDAHFTKKLILITGN